MSVMEEDILQERYELASGRVRELAEELAYMENEYLSPEMTDYFAAVAYYLSRLLEKNDNCVAKAVADRKDSVLDGNTYESSFLNPAHAVTVLGTEHGRILSWLYYELHSLEPFVTIGYMQDIVIRLELFLEIYAAYTYEWRENGQLPEYETIRRIMYWFAFDYADVAAEQYVEELAAGVSHGDGIYLNSASILYEFVPGVGRRNEMLRCQARCREAECCAADHQADIAMILDRAYVSRKLEVFRTALEKKAPIKVETECPELVRFGGMNGFSREQKNFLEEYCRQIKKYVAQLV